MPSLPVRLGLLLPSRTVRRRPGEQIGLNEAHSFVPDFPGLGRRDGEHFRGRVHGRDVRGVAEKLPGPRSGTAGEFQHAPGRPECLKCLGQLVAAGNIQALA
jgi:hypothetical protein